MPQLPDEGGYRRRDRDRDDYDRGGGGDRDRGADRRGHSDSGRRYAPLHTRHTHDDNCRDTKYERLNKQCARSYYIFKDVAQLWDLPLWMYATIRMDPRADPRYPTHYFCDPDG